MSAVRMDGKALSAKVRGSILAETEELKKKGVTPGLAVIIVGNDPASEIYVRNKERACEQCGFYSEKYALPEETSQEELLGLIAQLNESPQISGILCQMPVPKHISEQAVIDAIAGAREVTTVIDQYLGGEGKIDETLVERTLNPELGPIKGFGLEPRVDTIVVDPETRMSPEHLWDKVDNNFTCEMAPVTELFFCTPYPTTTTSSNA